ncbi:hypothetical protein [Haloarcula marismortui]|uniref:Uncharacterized protein n=1 Tax=Haloarcula marismortui ATCC 33799 TaxID=662475 RepID=M0KUQ6_9EURY|nr:hypothetical protein [Haloarcula californiae]EMA23954.1 hypothetical protein C435_03508 [Haloarcula californiae ATCC 33799]
MNDYTTQFIEQPIPWLKALAVCFNGQWIENGDTVGLTVSRDGFATDVELDAVDQVLSVSHQSGHTIQWKAPLKACRLTQRTDDSQLLTKLAATCGERDSEPNVRSLAVWGPRARFRGGTLKMTEPEVDAEQKVLSRIVERI